MGSRAGTDADSSPHSQFYLLILFKSAAQQALDYPQKKERRRRIIMFALLGIDSDRSAKPKMPEPLRGIGFCLEGMNQNLYTK